MIEGQKIIITGGGGFIGSHLADKLAASNDVTVIDHFSKDAPENLNKSRDNIKIIKADLSTPVFDPSIFKSTNIVFHLASFVGSYHYYQDKALEVLVKNTQIDHNVFKAAEEYGVEKVFYASSSHVYPKELQVSENSLPLKEEDAYPANPSLSYGWNKLSSEKYLSYCGDKFKVAIARYNGIYGPRQSTDLHKGSIIPVLIERAKKYPDLEYKILTQGHEKRAFCYVDDAIEGTLKIIEALDDASCVGPLNIGMEKTTTILSLAHTIRDLINPSIALQVADPPLVPEILCQYCDCSKALVEIGWKATTSVEQGIEKILK